MPALLISFPREGGEEGERLNDTAGYSIQIRTTRCRTSPARNKECTTPAYYHTEQDTGIICTIPHKAEYWYILYHKGRILLLYCPNRSGHWYSAVPCRKGYWCYTVL
jgi:hypothetical protein